MTPKKSRLGLKLLALFFGVFIAGFVGFSLFDMVISASEQALSPTTNTAAVTAIDPQLEKNLAKVLEPTEAQDTADIKNPFADATGISDKTAGLTTNAAPQTTTRPGGPSTLASSNVSVRTNNSVREPARTTLGMVNGSTNNVAPNPLAETRARLEVRDQRMRLGEDAGPEAVAYAVDDLLPVGVVGGGDGRDEVMFYSTAACRVVSFPVGTQFYDGWVERVGSEGVVFGFFDQLRTMRMRSWGRSVQNCTEKTNGQSNSMPILNVGGDE